MAKIIENDVRRVIEQNRTLAGDRVYPTRAPRGTRHPYITWLRTDTVIDASVSDCLPQQPVIQYSIWSDSYDQARQLAVQLDTVLVSVATKRNDFDAPEDDPDVYQVVQEWLLEG